MEATYLNFKPLKIYPYFGNEAFFFFRSILKRKLVLFACVFTDHFFFFYQADILMVESSSIGGKLFNYNLVDYVGGSF